MSLCSCTAALVWVPWLLRAFSYAVLSPRKPLNHILCLRNFSLLAQLKCHFLREPFSGHKDYDRFLIVNSLRTVHFSLLALITVFTIMWFLRKEARARGNFMKGIGYRDAGYVGSGGWWLLPSLGQEGQRGESVIRAPDLGMQGGPWNFGEKTHSGSQSYSQDCPRDT